MFETMRAKEKIPVTANGNSIYEQESLNGNTEAHEAIPLFNCYCSMIFINGTTSFASLFSSFFSIYSSSATSQSRSTTELQIIPQDRRNREGCCTFEFRLEWLCHWAQENWLDEKTKTPNSAPTSWWREKSILSQWISRNVVMGDFPDTTLDKTPRMDNGRLDRRRKRRR